MSDEKKTTLNYSELASLLATGTIIWQGEPCPQCGEHFTSQKMIHRSCLEKTWHGQIPQEIEELIKEFELDKGE